MFCWDFCSAFSMAAEIKLWSSPGVNQVSPFASMTGPTVLVNRSSRTLQIIPKYLDITWTYCFTMFYIVFTVSSAVGKKKWESHRNIKYTKDMWWIYSLNNESTVHHSPPSSTIVHLQSFHTFPPPDHGGSLSPCWQHRDVAARTPRWRGLLRGKQWASWRHCPAEWTWMTRIIQPEILCDYYVLICYILL